RFNNLPDGNVLSAGGAQLAASYAGGAGGNDFVLTAVQAPLVTTAAAPAIGGDTATLNGSADANGTAATVSFEYGTSSGVYAKTAPATPGNLTGNSPTAVNAVLTGLSPNTAYYFRVNAVGAGFTTFGALLSFTTQPSGTPPGRLFLPF